MPRKFPRFEIDCACGCGSKIWNYDKYGRKRTYKDGHIRKNKKFPEQSGTNHWNWKGGYYSHEGYLMRYAPNHPASNKEGHIREHRLVMEECLGRYLKSNEIVHHKNGIKTDNIIANLRLMTRTEHALFHRLGNSEASVFRE
jgi:hypothetical protein